MDGKTLELLTMAIAAIVSMPLVATAVRAFFFFGQLSTSVKGLTDQATQMQRTVEHFTAEVRNALSEHEVRLTTIEAGARAAKPVKRR